MPLAPEPTFPGNRDPLDAFRPATAAWFRAAFAAPTPAQSLGWPAISAGEHTLICAPTGSGKTLAAFLWCLDRLFGGPVPADPLCRLRVLYVSPLKALVHDVERNLRAPLAGIHLAAEARGETPPEIRVGMRTGDTPSADRRAFGKRPPDILVTTPESLYLLLTSSAREALRSVEWVIVDEIHAVAGTKRGAHLALSLERLASLADRPPQRIGLSATQRPLSAIAGFLGGRDDRPRDDRLPDGDEDGDGTVGLDEFPPRPVTIVDAGARKPLQLEVVVPVEDMSRIGELIPLDEAPGGPAAGPAERVSIWPSIYPRVLELIRAHRSTIVFVNSRRLAERLAQRLNELAGEELVRAHHGSLAREQRVQVEEALKAGRLPAIVATSSLELGIDMGAVDLVIQVESPGSVARGLQRIGRAGHSVDEPSHGVIFPKYRGDLLECAVVTRAMRDGAIESTMIPRNPLDVLAQQVVAACSEQPWPVDQLFRLVRRAENYAGLSRDAYEAVLGMLEGRYPSDEFAELRPRIVWDRAAGTVRAREDARRVAVQSGGTIPDRGLFGVYLDEGDGGEAGRDAGGAGVTAAAAGARGGRRGGRRVGELDEEMVYETRPGEVILLGASAWRVERITQDRVLVRPAPGEPGKVPFWKGEGPGRPFEFGRAIGAFTRELADDLHRGRRGRAAAIERLTSRHDLDPLAAENLLAYLEEEEAATGALASDSTVVIERFRDELGDWRVCLLTPFGGRVHAPWALAIEARLRERLGLEIQPLWSDDGIVFRLPSTEGDGAGGEDFGAIEAAILPDPDEIEDLVVGAVGGSALFAARFRENAARALLLPRTRGGQRRPLWQMRQRASQLLAVASRYGSFPIVLETYRECLQDVFDLPALRELLAAVRRRDIRVHAVETRRASPFAASLLFSYIAVYMYEGDAPLVDRRAQALALDRELLRELIGAEELRDLIDPGALADLELEMQALTPERAAGSADAVHDLLRRLGDLSGAEVEARVRGADGGERRTRASGWLAALAADRRAVVMRIAGEQRWIAAADAGRFGEALGAAVPPGLPVALLDAGPDPLGGLLARWARTHGPFTSDAPAGRWDLPQRTVERTLERLLGAGTILRGEFRPGGLEREWCDPEVLRALRRRSLARLRREVEPVEPAAYARFLPAWHGVTGTHPAAAGRPAGSGVAPDPPDRPATLRTPGSAASPAALDRLAEVIAQLEGVPLPASVLERDVLAARVPGYGPRLLHELGAAGEVCWVGRGRLGRDDGRIALYRPDRLALLAGPGGGPDAAVAPGGWVRDALVAHLGSRGASFYRDLNAAALAAARDLGERAPSQRELLDSLWDLAWDGLVTNDTFGPLRALRWRRPGGDARPRGVRLVPPEGAGRWSLVDDGRASTASPAGAEPGETERRHALALGLLERQGIVTRDGVAAEAVPGGFAAVYPVLREMEDRGRVRRGYFVDGLGGAQFAIPGAVDRLRAERRLPGTDPFAGAGPSVLVLAAADPAQPYGGTLPWPRRGDDDRRPLPRAAGAYVALVDGEPACYLERGGRSLQTLPVFDRPGVAGPALAALGELVAEARLRSVQIERIDGEAAGASRHRAVLEAAGFRRGYRGWVLAIPARARAQSATAGPFARDGDRPAGEPDARG